MNALFRLFLAITGFLLCADSAQAQFNLKAGKFNHLHKAPAPTDPGSTVVTPQFAGQWATTAAAGAISTAPEHHNRYPSAVRTEGATLVAAMVLERASVGGVFASGVPRYSMGDEIDPPTTGHGSAGDVLAGYWRGKPVDYGEVFTQPAGTTTTPLPNPNSPDPAPAHNYYYSPHAKRVFAHQAGQVVVMWVTQVPVAPDGTPNGAGTKEFRFKTETFSVSSGSSRPVRTIFWTERTFNGPAVNIPSGRIVTVNPVFNVYFPQTVAEEYQAVGVVEPIDPSAAAPEETRTLWFQKTGGLGQLHAYNAQGRILVEYLGALQPGGGEPVHEFLGADIVEVTQAAPAVTATVNLGEQLLPHDAAGTIPDNADALLPSAALNIGLGAVTYYGTSSRPDGRLVYHAERENTNPDKVSFYWLEENDASIHFLTGPATPNLGIAWPKYLNKYIQVWPGPIADYHGLVTVEDTGSTADTGIQFSGGGLPTVVYQDDGAQTEARVAVETQRLVVDFSASLDKTNRTLLKFNSGAAVWYVRLFIQSQSILGSPEIPEVPDPDGAGPLLGTPLIPAVYTLADRNADGVRDLSIAGGKTENNVVVGQRIERPDDSYEPAGYIAQGTGYHPAAYQDPFVAGVEAAAAGAIIPVNAIPGQNEFTVWWFSEVSPPGADFTSFHVPSASATYSVSYPSGADRIVLASNAGTGDLSPAQAAGTLYFQNDSSLPGFNPNEEHAMMLAGRAYALRDDLNVTSGSSYTSQPFVLVSYVDPADNRPAVRVFEVLREIDLHNDGIADPGDVLFNYAVNAGAQIPAPMPLPFLPLPLDGSGVSANTEVDVTPDPAPDRTGPVTLYDQFTVQDRKGYSWVYRGPHDGGTPTMGMQFYYTMREGFFIPGVTQPAVGAILPYLRPLNAGVPQGDPVAGTPLTVIYRPVWPTAVPELRVAETLTLPKFGLPQVRGQSSAEVLYQQSIALGGSTGTSVTLHDPTRAKKVKLSSAGVAGVPPSIATTSYQGRTYFQRLAPHLQQRCYVIGDELVLEGAFVDEIAGEDYLNLNVLSAEDLQALQALDDLIGSAWDNAVAGLHTWVQTFIEDPAKKGTYKVAGSVNVDAITLAETSDSDTAVDSYALTATGQGTGYISLLFGDGEAFTPEGDPVSIGIIKVTPRLYVGDMKVQYSSNPLDEQVTLRHSGDFAAKPDDYEFEWRYAPLADGLPPATYVYDSPVTLLGNSTTWKLAQNPAGNLPTDGEYAAGTDVPVPRSLTIHDADHAGGNLPGAVMRSNTAVDFSGGLPAQVIFSADLSEDLDGFVLHVNGKVALAFRAPQPFTNSNPVSGLSGSGLTHQFDLSTYFFTKGPNTVEVALYSTADPLFSSQVNFRLETVSRLDRVDPAAFGGSPWQQPGGTLQNIITLGGSPSAPLGNPVLLLQDNAFTVRYRPRLGSGNILTAGAGDQNDVAWSDWMNAQVVPGWVKRVLDAINPFNQRMTDLYNNAVNTDVSVLTQAGTRWEGDIALNLDNINDVGLIEIYETVLNRAKMFSIDNGYDVPGVNDALLLAAGYLNDLYVLLGNEAYADAANPTISLDDEDTITEVNTSRFSFEGQVASSLEEELALLRGRDDFLATSVATAPAYNRLYWNYTNGIDSGEVLYAVNYNIKEKAGSSTANGVIDAADAQRMFPQAHGDAYGHYLTALKGYYRLLTNPNFTWTPRSEVVQVLGQNVSVDYYDERKFAGAAADLARTAEQILTLTQRQAYQDDPAAGWAHFRDDELNSRTNQRRQWGVDEWASRATSGAYLNWLAGNAMLPDVDDNPQHTGIQIIDRQTVPELAEVAAIGGSLQTTLDHANARLNPLGLSPAAIAFDISPAELKAGKSHFEQVYDRALGAVLNAKGAFDQAGRMTGLLRNQANRIDDYNTAIEQQERAFTYQLIDLYGSPYAADVGPGKTYAQGYSGPDLQHWFIIDRFAAFAGTTKAITVTVKEPQGIDDFTGFALDDLERSTSFGLPKLDDKTITIQPSQIAQYNDVWNPAGLGSRATTGELQFALEEVQRAMMAFSDANLQVQKDDVTLSQKLAVFNAIVANHIAALDKTATAHTERAALTAVANTFFGVSALLAADAEVTTVADAIAEAFPKSVGLANDATSGARSAVKLAASLVEQLIKRSSLIAQIAGLAAGAKADEVARALALDLSNLDFDSKTMQLAFEINEAVRATITHQAELAQLALSYQRALEDVNNVMARGDRILAEREVFRKRAAAIVQGYRTKDLTFRTFRNEALEQYRTLFDLGARYTYLAAKSYDYETGLLGTPAGQAVINRIVASRALGDLSGNTPQATTSTLGDSGLAGAMARMVADFSVAKGRLGINNPDQNGTLFSLRHELFRLTDDPSSTADDAQWQQTLEQHIVSDLMSDSDAAAYCRSLGNSSGGRVPGLIIPFSTTIRDGYNFFGLPLAGGDHSFSESNFATKIYTAGIVLKGYVGMNPYTFGAPDAGGPATGGADTLSATPYVYLIPTGTDSMLAPAFGDTGVIRSWDVADQALPLPYNLGATDFNGTQFFQSNGTLTERPWILRKHQAFRPVDDPAFFYSLIPQEFTSSRLVGRSVWNSQWKLVIPAYTLLDDEEEGLNRFVRNVSDIQIFLRTYSHSGN